MDFITAFGQSSIWLSSWALPTALALAISSASIAIAWMIGEALKSSEVKNWAKKELNEFIFSCILVGLIIFFLSSLYMISILLAEGNIYDISIKFLSDPPATGFDTWFKGATRAVGSSFTQSMGLYYQSLSSAMLLGSKGFTYEFLGDVQYNLAWLLKGILKLVGLIPGAKIFAGTASALMPDLMIKPFGAVDDISSALDSFSTTAFLGALLAFGQVQAVRFFQTVGLQIILPIGIVLRAAPITRKTGSTLIAIALVGASVYPLSIVASKAIYDRTHDIFGAPAITAAKGSVIVSVVSPVDGTRVALGDKIVWAVDKGSTFSIWVSSDECACPGPQCFEGNDPPTDKNIIYWKSGDPTFECHARFPDSLITDTADDNQVEMKVSNLTLGETNKIYSFILDAYDETGSHIGWGESRVIVDDPCKRNFGSRLKCLIGLKYAIKLRDVGGLKSLETSLYSALGGMISTVGDFGSASIQDILRSWMTPALASKAYLAITDRIPELMFPPFMSIVSLVISAFMTLSSFRGLSAAIGGEVELPGIGKIV